jgi:hypothetical protein
MTTTLVTMDAMDVCCLSLLLDTLTKTLSDTYQNHYAFSHIQKSSTEILAVEPRTYTEISTDLLCKKENTCKIHQL